MASPAPVVLFLLALGALAGCVAPLEADEACGPATATALYWPGSQPGARLGPQTADGRLTQGVLLVQAAGVIPLPTDGSPPATVALLGQTGSASFWQVDVAPDEHRVVLSVDLVRACDGAQVGGVSADLVVPRPAGDAAAAGRGAIVYTAGFWTNGTLFYTNDPGLDASPWPRATWYAWGGDAPLRVYVYEEDPSEQPPHWKGVARNVGSPGTPADATLQGTATAVDALLGAGYVPTIPGFNEGLKGLTTTTVQVVEVAPEDGYTRPGYEGHPLYGDRLVFVQQVAAVHPSPCFHSVRTACVPSAA